MFRVRPRGCEPFVGDASKQEGVAREQQAGLELLQLIIPVGIAPAAEFDLPDPAGILHDTIGRDVFGGHDSAHR
jgi:hypothetical protein